MNDILLFIDVHFWGLWWLLVIFFVALSHAIHRGE